MTRVQVEVIGDATPVGERLFELEAVVERGLATFVEVGAALMEIRDARLYLETHETFEDYCQTRWGFTDRRARQLMTAAEIGTIVPVPNEGQARELVPLLDQPEAMRETWAQVRELHPQPTAEDVREVVRSRMGVHYSSATPEWETPQDLFDTLHAEFGFTLDVCATADNAKCPDFFTVAQDGLAQDWTGVCWMNPPYDGIRAWVEMARLSANAGATVVCLVPARVDTGWWWDNCRHGEIRFLRGRLKFGGGDTAAPFPSAVVIFPREPKVVWWER